MVSTTAESLLSQAVVLLLLGIGFFFWGSRPLNECYFIESGTCFQAKRSRTVGRGIGLGLLISSLLAPLFHILLPPALSSSKNLLQMSVTILLSPLAFNIWNSLAQSRDSIEVKQKLRRLVIVSALLSIVLITITVGLISTEH
jgi:hypothetical protein